MTTYGATSDKKLSNWRPFLFSVSYRLSHYYNEDNCYLIISYSYMHFHHLTHRSTSAQNSRYFADDILNWILLKEKIFLLKKKKNLFPVGAIAIIYKSSVSNDHWFRQFQVGTEEAINFTHWWPVHTKAQIYVTRPQWVHMSLNALRPTPEVTSGTEV